MFVCGFTGSFGTTIVVIELDVEILVVWHFSCVFDGEIVLPRYTV